MAHGVFDRALPGIRDTGAVTEEDHIKAAALGRARNLFEHADVWMMPVNPGVGQAPMRLDHRPRQIKREVYLLLHWTSLTTDRRIPSTLAEAIQIRGSCRRR